MVSYMKKMIWGETASQQSAAAASNNAEEDKEESVGPAFTGRVTAD